MKKILLFLFLAALILIGGFFISSKLLPDIIVFEKTFAPEKIDKVVIYAVGDIMLDRGVKYMVYKHGNGDYSFPFKKIAPFLKKADIVFGNLESQISDKGYKIGTVNSFRVEPKAALGLKYAGFDIVSVANNHSFDYTAAALKDSFSRLDEAGIKYVGGGANEDEAFGLKVIEANNTKIGFLAYCSVGAKGWAATDKSPGIAFLSDDNIERIKGDIQRAKEQVDVLIVTSHSGEEYQTEENEYQRNLYQSFIESGADVVLGHHPHVMQPLKGNIMYSLGNFVFDQGFSLNTMKGSLLEITIENKKVTDINQKLIKMNEYFQPEAVD